MLFCAAVSFSFTMLILSLLIRSRCNTLYVGATYCYRPISVICRLVGLSQSDAMQNG